METLPEILPVNRLFHTETGDWEVTLEEEPNEFAQQTCVRFKYLFTQRDSDGRILIQRRLSVMMPKHELVEEHEEEQVRRSIHDWLSYTTELESTLNEYGCELESPPR
jgi:hypothetical protein